MLYVGTETGLYVSLDDGATWRRWRSNFPVTPVYDLGVHGTDLVVATHGRSFWIVDDLTPLRPFAARGSDDDDGLLSPPRSAWRLVPGVMDFITATEGKDYSIGLGKPATFIATRDDSGQVQRCFLDAGESAPVGAIVYYYLPEYVPADRTAGDRTSVSARLAEEVYREKFGIDAVSGTTSAAAVADAAGQISASLAVLDERGKLVREYRPKPAGYDKLSDEDKALDPGPWMPVRAGVNRFVWDLRYAGASRLRGNKTGEEAERGPLVLPGTYSVHLRLGFQNPLPYPPTDRLAKPTDSVSSSSSGRTVQASRS